MTKTNHFENKYVKGWIEDGIMFLSYMVDEINLNAAKECIALREGISKGNTYPIIIDIKNLKKVSKEVRTYLAKEGCELLSAGALIAGSPVSAMIGNFFINISKPAIPSRIFTNYEDALDWLKQYK